MKSDPSLPELTRRSLPSRYQSLARLLACFIDRSIAQQPPATWSRCSATRRTARPPASSRLPRGDEAQRITALTTRGGGWRDGSGGGRGWAAAGDARRSEANDNDGGEGLFSAAGEGAGSEYSGGLGGGMVGMGAAVRALQEECRSRSSSSRLRSRRSRLRRRHRRAYSSSSPLVAIGPGRRQLRRRRLAVSAARS